jgi:hypothetical protein
VATLVLQLVTVLALLTALAGALTAADRWVSGQPPRHRLRHRLRHRHSKPVPAPEPPRRPIQVVAADLRRLSRQLALVPAGASLVRWRALWAAYDDVLMEAADQLEVPHELRDAPLGTDRDIERIRLLAALDGAGLAVRA